jgi:hypothetical protein
VHPARASATRAAIPVLVAGACIAVPRSAAADGLAEIAPPRTTGRAGTGLVSDDGAGAVLAAPAGLARRDVVRAQAAAVVVDHDLSIVTDTPASPAIDDRGTPVVVPQLAAQGAIGPVVIGAAIATTAARERRLPAPRAMQPDGDVSRLFPHRYAGLSSTARRDTVAVGAALRATEWLAVGAGAALSRVELAETRRLWAGFSGRDPLGSPARDVDLALDGADDAVPSLTASALLAPASAPLELAIAASWSADLQLEGGAAASSDGTPGVAADAPSARLAVAAPIVVRAGARWLGERWAIEVGGDAWIYRGGIDAPRWSVRGLGVVDDTSLTAAIDDVPALLAQRSHGALRAALDVEVASGFVWLTAGWAWTGASVPPGRQTAAFADLGGHTAAAGVEISAGGVTIAAGWSRTLATARAVPGHVDQVNPFDAGAAPANAGRYDGARDAVGLSVELALD